MIIDLAGDRTLCLIFSRSLGAIAHAECFANALPWLFSRENLKGVKVRSQFWRMKMWGGAIASSEYFVNVLDIPLPLCSQGKI
ncbi:hypothetical protein [Cylindrospermopsis raciborskii]|uniref:hypothetical protein n=1 Tax=Cylindrospermopsis raciborskii TaxID=77022 RepID=UPI00128F2C9F|nr:hypothetical protein [Cylindrospermopsis raciborskii]